MSTTPERAAGFTPASLQTTLGDLSPVLSVLQQASVANADSSDWIDSLLTKGLAAAAIFHPSLNVGQWEPVIMAVSVALVVVENAVRRGLKQKKVSAALGVIETALKNAPLPTIPAPTPDAA